MKSKIDGFKEVFEAYLDDPLVPTISDVIADEAFDEVEYLIVQLVLQFSWLKEEFSDEN